MNQVVQNYLKISSEIGAHPIPELLSCLSAGIKICSISSPTELLSDGQVIALCAVLPLSNIEELTFHNLALNINSWVAIADACSKCKSLQKLFLKDLQYREGQGVPTFARALAGSEVQVLEVSNCKLGDEFAAGLTDGVLLKGDKLNFLRLAACNISDEGACKLAKTLEAVGMMSSLKTLDLSYNRIGDKGACALGAMLISEGAQSSLPLQALELEGNLISDVGGLALARAAKGALVLSRLNISINHCTDSTLHALAEALRFNTGTLKEVAAAGARAQEDAAIALIKAATRNNSLQLLDIRGVHLGAEGVNQLCQMLRYTATLNTLRVDVATREGGEAIARELPNNRSLMHLTIGGPVPESLLSQMSEILATNTMRNQNVSPARSPHIHLWMENATLGNAVSGHTAAAQQQSQRQSRSSRPRSRSPSPGPGLRSPRSEAGGSVYSRGTTQTQRTATTYLSFQFSQMSRKTGISSSPLRISQSLAAGGAAEKAAVIFRKHDVNQDNYLNRDEMLAALQEVGVFNGIRANKVGRLLEHEFKKADWDNDGRISLQDFISYYEKIAFMQTQLAREGRIRSASHKHSIPVGTENNIALKRVFKNYCKYALGQGRVYQQEGVPHMNAQQFHRLCQDAGFVEPEGRLTTTAVDVVFYRYRPAGARRLGFKEFVEALAAVAYEAGLQFEDVMVALGCRGPNPLTPEGSARGSEASAPAAGMRSTQEELLVDPSFGNFMAPGLESIQEVPTPLPGGNTPPQPRLAMVTESGPAAVGGKGAARPSSPGRKKKKATKSAATSNAVSNPLFESVDGRQMYQSSFDMGSSAAPAMRSSAAGDAKSAAADARYRMELESRLSQLETRLSSLASTSAASQAAGSGAGAAGGAAGAGSGGSAISGVGDTGVTAASIAGRLSKLEATLSTAVIKQEELEGVSKQMTGLQDILSKLADEISRMKATGGQGSLGGGSGGVDPAAHVALSKQVDGMSNLVNQLAADVRGVLGRVDGLASQVASMALENKALAAKQAQSSGGNSSSGGGIPPEVLAALEKKFMDRQARFEGALMQVARQVDVLDARLKEEQENSLKAIETIIATSQGGGAAAALSGAHSGAGK